MTAAANVRHGSNDQSSRPRYVLVPLEAALDADLTDGAFRTFCVLRRYCYGSRNQCWPSLRTLASDRNCSEETVRRHIRELSSAGLLTVARRGRGNLYVFPEMPEKVSPHVHEAPNRPTPHTDEGLRFERKENLETSPVCSVSGDTEVHQSPTPARLEASGVSAETARRLVRQYGREICEQALGLLEQYRIRGSEVRNPGGWLYCAITKGFVKPVEVAKTQIVPPQPPEGDDIHEETLRRRRREALAKRGISEEAEALWERVCGRLKSEDGWSPALAAACLRQAGERAFAVMGPGGALAAKLRAMLPAITTAVRDETGWAECVVTAG